MIDLSNADSGTAKLANIVDAEGSVAAISVKSLQDSLSESRVCEPSLLGFESLHAANGDR